MSTEGSVSILGYKVFAGSKEYFADGVTGVVATLNPHSYVMARRDERFREALMSADILIPDGTGIQLAARVLEGRRIEKIAGSDLHEVIVNSLSGKGGSCFYLGSSDETQRRITERLSAGHPDVRAGEAMEKKLYLHAIVSLLFAEGKDQNNCRSTGAS